MDNDYSGYKPTEYEKYRWLRSNDQYIIFNKVSNFAIFSSSNKTVRIQVSQKYEFINMYYWIEDEVTEEQLRKFAHEHTITEEDIGEDPKKFLEDRIAEQKKYLESFDSRYDIDRIQFEKDEDDFYKEHPDIEYKPLNNVLSGCNIMIPLGEGILDFIYADFDSAYQDETFVLGLLFHYREEYLQDDKREKSSETKNIPPEKINNTLDGQIQDYFDFMFSCDDTRKISAASLYTAVCPPVLKRDADNYLALKRYYLYLKALQKEYLEILQFCFDEEYYPELLGDLNPAERYYTFRMVKDFPSFIERNEELYMAFAPLITKEENGPHYYISIEKNKTDYPEELLEQLAAELNTTTDTLSHYIRSMRRLTSRYSFASTEEILELELSKMLENDIRFRKCKRCGKYFIMKGNYDTRYCDRIAEGETRSCQELAAQENYKKKMAENKALPIYSKYYKRYAARVKVRQIKEDDFKKWKYEALVKRDECTTGKITTEEYIDWLESCFPNRRSKNN